MGKVDIWMPLYLGDYLKKTMHLNTEQHGAFLLLRMHFWMHGPIPDDDDLLAGITRLTGDKWATHRRPIQALFNVADGTWIDEELAERKESTDKRKTRNSNGAKAVNEKRWGGRQTGDTTGDELGDPQAIATESPNGSPPASPTDRKSKSKSKSEEKQKTLSSNGAFDKALFALEPPVGKEQAVEEVFAYYLDKVGRTKSIYSLTESRRKKGLARLDEALTMTEQDLCRAVELMKTAVDELCYSDWHMGRDPKSTGRGYFEWEDHLFRSQEQFQKWLALASENAVHEQNANHHGGTRWK